MAYNDEALKAKLSTLSETQESIVSVSSWITFHRRHADRIASVWLTRLKDSPPPKRLNYVYLVNDIVQNAKARKRPEFPNAFAPIIAEAVQQAYRSSPADIQNKIKRVVDVWKARGVFEESILQAINSRVEDVDQTKAASGKKTLMGNSLFASSSGPAMPKELASLGPLQTAVSKAEFMTRPLVETAQTEYIRLNDPDTPRPSPPVYAAGLSSLIKKSINAEASLKELIDARRSLRDDLKRVLDANEATLVKDESLLADLADKRSTEEIKKQEVENIIVRDLAAVPQDNDIEPGANDSRPDVEELTPEPEGTPPPPQPEATPARNPGLQGILAGFGDSTDSNTTVPISPPVNYASVPNTNGNGPSSSKKRKLSHDTYAVNEAAVPDLGAMGVTGFDGMMEQPVQAYPSNDAIGHTSEFNAIPGFTQGPTTLEQDVDALIRGRENEYDIIGS